MVLDKILIFIVYCLIIVEWIEKVVVLDQGKIVEEGNYVDLFVQGGFYVYLVNSQKEERMKLEFLESVEFYNCCYYNFFSWVIVFMFFLFVFLFGFVILVEKEMSMFIRVIVEFSCIFVNIQLISNNCIFVNYLEESKLVKKGELLV